MKRTYQAGNNSINHSVFRHNVFLIALAWFAISPMAQAVNPPPDGGYPGGNTVEGQGALFSRTTGTYNTALGYLSLHALTDGGFCTGVGAGTLLLNTADENTATGAGALLSNTIGADNTAHGAFALFSNTQGSFNTAVGDEALFSNTAGSFNTANGESALFTNTTGIYNTATGANALVNNTTGEQNTANGVSALFTNTTGGRNTANGVEALFSNQTGNDNTADGFNALVSNTTGSQNTANGTAALASNIEGSDNTANGFAALASNTAGSSNTAIGHSAGSSITGSGNVCIGSGVSGVPGESGTTRIRNIGGTVYNTGLTVQVDFDGKLGFIGSSRRYKDDIKPMDKASEILLALKPVTFRYKGNIDPAHVQHYGLIAEEVEKVNPDLVVCNADGKSESVRFDSINAMLLNEFLKEHRKVAEQASEIHEQATAIAQLTPTMAQQQKEFQSTIARQQKELERVIARLKEQDSTIQKLSDRIEVSKFARRTAERIRPGGPASKMVVNNRDIAEPNK